MKGVSGRVKSFFAVALGVCLIASVALNWVLYQRDRADYAEIHRVRLDPLGLSAVWPTPVESSPEASLPVAVMYGDSRAQDWPTGAVVSGYRIVNRGIGAQTTAQVLGRFDAHVVTERPSVVIIQVGINDLKAIPLFPSEEEGIVANCEMNIQEIVDKSRAIGARVVLSTVFPVGRVPIERLPVWSDRIPASVLEVNEFIGSLAGPDIVVLDGWTILANEQGQMRPEYSLDTLHVNALGYEALNTELEAVLEQLNQ